MRLTRDNIYLASVDTEDDGRGNVSLFAFVHEKGSVIYEDRTKALEFLYDLGRTNFNDGYVTVLFATNLEYDIVNLFGMDRIRETKLIFGKSYLVGAEWTKHNVVFRDTVRHLPVSVKELGEMIGLEKLERETKNLEDAKRYCMRDATITFRAARFIVETYLEYGITPKMTLASSAYNIWSKNFWKAPVYYPEKEIVDLAKQCYYGGRTEPFAIGTFKDVTVIDASSMFPWAMIKDDLPLPWGLYERINSSNSIPDGYGIYNARLDIPLNSSIPALPFRDTDTGRLVFPKGIFDASYTSEELRYAISLGYQVSRLQGYKFLEKSNPFTDYVSEMFMRKNSSRGPARLLYKLLLNALYGKFNQGGEKIVALPLEDFAQLAEIPDDYTVWNGFAIYREEDKPPIWSNTVWPAFVTSRARIKLHQEMMRIMKSGGKVLYCDTDSVIFQGGNIQYPEKARKPGDFELRGQFEKLIIAGKKEYGLYNRKSGWDIHVKGVPFQSRESYLLSGVASYERPIRLKESARRNINANVWIPFIKRRKITYQNRIANASGDLTPIVIRHKANKRRGDKSNGTA